MPRTSCSPLTHPHGAGADGTQLQPTFREEILRNIAELDQLVDEILLASRLDTRKRPIARHRGRRGSDRPAARRKCARVDGPGRERRARGAGLRGISSCCARHSQPAGKRPPLQHGRNHRCRCCAAALAEVRVCDRGPGVPLDLNASSTLLPPARRQRNARSPGAGGSVHWAPVLCACRWRSRTGRLVRDPDASPG